MPTTGPWAPYSVLAGGYVTDCSWHGYGWTADSGTGSTVTPASFTTLAAGGQLCAQGTVAGLTDYSGTGMVGLNINQAQTGTPTPPVNSYTPTGTGITYNLTNTGQSALRIQIQAADGATNANDRWCATVDSATGTIPWASFNTQCWTGGTGVAYAMQPITAVIVIVPGALTPTTYNFCINSISEAGAACASGTGSSGSTSSSSSSSSSGTVNTGNCTDTSTFVQSVASQYTGAMIGTNTSKTYYFNPNWWDSYSGETEAVSGLGFTINNANAGSVGTNPLGFPTIFIGAYGGNTTVGSNLPKSVSALTTIPTVYSSNGFSMGATNHNATYDVWFTANGTPIPNGQSTPGNGGGYSDGVDVQALQLSASRNSEQGHAPGHRRERYLGCLGGRAERHPAAVRIVCEGHGSGRPFIRSQRLHQGRGGEQLGRHQEHVPQRRLRRLRGMERRHGSAAQAVLRASQLGRFPGKKRDPATSSSSPHPS